MRYEKEKSIQKKKIKFFFFGGSALLILLKFCMRVKTGFRFREMYYKTETKENLTLEFFSF